MHSAIQSFIEKEFGVKLSDDEFERIRESCGEFDPIYDNCFASDFFWAEFAIEFVSIENVKLTSLLEKRIKR